MKLKISWLTTIPLICFVVTIILYSIEGLISNLDMTQWFYNHVSDKINYIQLLGWVSFLSAAMLLCGSIATIIIITYRWKKYGESNNKKVLFLAGGGFVLGMLAFGSVAIGSLLSSSKNPVMPITSSSSPVIAPKPSVLIASGHYERKNASLDVEKITTTTFKFQAHAEWIGNAELGQVNEGNVAGELTLMADNTATYQDPDFADCALRFSFTENAVKIEDANTACGGLNVSFSGEYRITQLATEKSNWSLMDYYKMIPSEFFEVTLEQAFQGHSRDQIIIDENNYYLYLPSDDGLPSTEIAVFLRPNKIGLVGVINTFCGPRCFQEVTFLDFQNGKWVHVEDQIFSEPTKEEIVSAFKRAEPSIAVSANNIKDPYALFEPILKLPRQGTTLKLIDSWTDVTLMTWRWTGEGFESV